MSLKQIEEWMDENMLDYCAVAKRKYIYVCKNNGQFHCGERNNGAGFAQFLGKFTQSEILDWIEWMTGEQI